MGKEPAVVIVARHGARLDAADQAWHLTSPAPYDPPLTYGGWTQSKALGLRIASLLHDRVQKAEADEKASNANADLAHLNFSPLDAVGEHRASIADGSQRPKRRQKIIIHSSPFLRCVQTSTAIAAGISQFQAPPVTTVKTPEPKPRGSVESQSPLTLNTTSAPAVQPPSPKNTADANLEVFPKTHIGPDKILLRVDAFLGEWLSPDYYTDITPPPGSTLMVATAKADLLRRADYIEVQRKVVHHHGHFPGGWVRSPGPASPGSRRATQDGGFPSMGSLAQALPRNRERSNSQNCLIRRNSGSRERGLSSLVTTHKAPDHIYDPPVPSYAVSPADPIPRGYVAHARDACLDIDFQWNSMRPPQEWGDGGEFGDEWSTMHKRFRRGLAGMMTWYKEYGSERVQDHFQGFTYRAHPFARCSPLPLLQRPSAKREPAPPPPPEEEDEDEELVLILVTHGAGCNALVGAITNQPVLIDVATASLSMAVKRTEPRRPSLSAPPLPRRRSVVDVGMAHEYEMKMIASVDHLRPGVDPAKLPQPQSPAVTVASPSLEYRRRFTGTSTTNSPIDSPVSLGQPWRAVNSSLGSIRRSSTSGSSQFYSGASQGSASPSLGLWSSLKPPTPSEPADGRVSPGSEMVANFQEHKPAASIRQQNGHTGADTNTKDATTVKTEQEHHAENDHVPPLPKVLSRSQSQSQQGLWIPKASKTTNGLWGPPRLEEISEHAKGPKRRWTMSGRD
ncbi:hypothetical protein BU24DRAFT_361252 [Aaosphaeria arxii CBS 175.79]|uniref:Phosphoglycerate mutase-like protein n=1 Tax=Aaosphaeria arxii CBS 175.79 TaxID=1450172 RepID=A0A6A5Y848_9PLEO|nr:uncharacterized protein BU24DRAFT_361252 [Aaosphaeria arxii CBS 175.79]KAF2020734.1 hypothetical protein BU24DRAFT_361252 [Aaosphaeria arxii CBS 175.79]